VLTKSVVLADDTAETPDTFEVGNIRMVVHQSGRRKSLRPRARSIRTRRARFPVPKTGSRSRCSPARATTRFTSRCRSPDHRRDGARYSHVTRQSPIGHRPPHPRLSRRPVRGYLLAIDRVSWNGPCTSFGDVSR
jgi:hypothetical protein